MTGTILQLQSTGIQDAFLTSKPEINIFKHVYYRYVNFSVETISLPFQNAVDFGTKTTFSIPFRGHYLSNMYLHLKLPKLLATSGSYASWTNGLGYAILEYIELEINGVVIDKRHSIYMDITDELTRNSDLGRDLMVLKSDLYRSSKGNADNEVDLMIPIDFFFTKQPNLALPLFGINNHQIKINFKLREFEDCIIYDGETPPDLVYVESSSLIVDYIYIDTHLAKSLSEVEHTYLIEQVQFNEVEVIPERVENVVSSLNFNHCCKELFFVFVEEESLRNNDYFNYSRRQDVNALVETISMNLNGLSRYDKIPESYFRLVTPHKCHTSVSNKHIYTIPFAIHPEKHQPTGSINLSRFDSVTLSLGMKKNNPSCMLYVYATTYNILKINNGLFKLEFAV